MVCRHHCWASHVQGLVLSPRRRAQCAVSFAACRQRCVPVLLEPTRAPSPLSRPAGGKAKPLTKPKAAAKDYSEEDKAFLEKKKAEEKAIKEAAAKVCVCVKGSRRASALIHSRLSTLFFHRPPSPQLGKKK